MNRNHILFREKPILEDYYANEDYHSLNLKLIFESLKIEILKNYISTIAKKAI